MDRTGDGDRKGLIAVIFTSRRTGEDKAGYAAAAIRMERLARAQPGFVGLEAARGPDGFGITVSYWTDEAAARRWRDQADHVTTREAGRARWYVDYTLTVATVTREYRWQRP